MEDVELGGAGLENPAITPNLHLHNTISYSILVRFWVNLPKSENTKQN
jgi:hypothetical protein